MRTNAFRLVPGFVMMMLLLSATACQTAEAKKADEEWTEAFNTVQVKIAALLSGENLLPPGDIFADAQVLFLTETPDKTMKQFILPREAAVRVVSGVYKDYKFSSAAFYSAFDQKTQAIASHYLGEGIKARDMVAIITNKEEFRKMAFFLFVKVKDSWFIKRVFSPLGPA